MIDEERAGRASESHGIALRQKAEKAHAKGNHEEGHDLYEQASEAFYSAAHHFTMAGKRGLAAACEAEGRECAELAGAA